MWPRYYMSCMNRRFIQIRRISRNAVPINLFIQQKKKYNCIYDLWQEESTQNNLLYFLVPQNLWRLVGQRVINYKCFLTVGLGSWIVSYQPQTWARERTDKAHSYDLCQRFAFGSHDKTFSSWRELVFLSCFSYTHTIFMIWYLCTQCSSPCTRVR